MADDGETNDNRRVALSVPIGGVAMLAVLGLALAGYLMASRESNGEEAAERSKSTKGNLRRRLGLMTLVTLIENDATRRVLVSVLRAIARRS